MKWYPRGILIALAGIFVLITASDSAPTVETGFVGGDYRAFYAVRQMITDGKSGQLYSARQQTDYQRELLDGQQILLPFA